MAYEKCPIANVGCKYWNYEPVVEGADNGCRADEHHIYTNEQVNRLEGAERRIAKQYRKLGQNVIQVCRINHEKIHNQGVEIPLPPVDEMLEAVLLWREERYNGKL